MDWLTLAGSLAGVGLVVAIVWAFRFGSATLTEEDEAKTLAGEMIAGFSARDAVICCEATGALVRGTDGRIVLLKRLGSHYAARALVPPVAVREIGPARLEIVSGDRYFGTVSMIFPDEVDAMRWREILETRAKESRE